MQERDQLTLAFSHPSFHREKGLGNELGDELKNELDVENQKKRHPKVPHKNHDLS